MFKKIFLVFFVLSLNAYAGGDRVGNGGKSVVCRNSDSSIRSVELLDLFEGRALYHLKYYESQLPWQEQVLALFKQSGIPTTPARSPEFNEIFDWYKNAIKHLNILPSDVTLKVTDDSYEVVAPKGCLIEQVAIYQTDNQILINGELWNAMSETQKAALLIHESSYRYLRIYGETNSIRARHFTAHVLSGGKIEQVSTGNGAKAVCGVPGFEYDTSFFIFPSHVDENGDRKVRLQFINIGHREILSKNFADIPLDTNENELWEELINPTYVFAKKMTTNSLFESGDDLILWVLKDNSGKSAISLTGISAINGSHFASNLICFLRR